jgi:hypothetical protein
MPRFVILAKARILMMLFEKGIPAKAGMTREVSK